MALKIVPTGILKASTGARLHEKTLAELAKKVATLPEIGKAKWQFDYQYTTGWGDQINAVDLQLTLTMEMPVWVNYPSRPKDEKEEWDRFYKALRFHEDEHHNLCKREAKQMYLKLSLAKTVNAIKSVYACELTRIQKLTDSFDKQVAHGKNQISPHGTTVITP